MHDEVHEIYVNRMLRALGFALIGAFIPVFIINIGYSVFDAITYLLIIYLSFGLLSPAAAVIESKIGLKKTALFGTLSLVTFFLFLFTLDRFSWPLYILAAFHGLALALYWIPINANFARSSIKKGTQTGVMLALVELTAVVGPLIGAELIIHIGFDPLVALVCGIMVFSAIPLFFTKDYAIKAGLNWSYLTTRANMHYWKLFVIEGAIYACIELWPLFVFLTVQEYLFVGIAATLAGMASAIFTYLIGRFSDHSINNREMILFGALFNVFVWTIAVFAVEPVMVLAVSFLKGFAMMAIEVPLFVLACSVSKKYNEAEVMAFREVALCVGRVLNIGVSLLLVSTIFIFSAPFAVAAVLALILAALVYFQREPF